MKDFDVIVIGSGAGGGNAAWEFVQKGKRVLIVERGRDLSFEEIGRDHLRNHRYAKYGHNTGPDLAGNPRTYVRSNGRVDTVNPIQGEFNNNAMAVGGGTRVYGAQAWRFHPLDFRMASTYGVPDGSSLADWPIDYDELAPYYESVEWELGVCGSPPGSTMPERRPYPMAAMPISRRGHKLQDAADSLGWAHQRVPLMINSVERDGRAACTECQHCVGFACPTDAKGGTQNTVIPKALATGRCEMWTETQVTRLVSDSQGKITGVRAHRDGEFIEIYADVIVLAAGAIESARLLLASPTAKEPNGVGNNHDQVGRHLQGHYYPSATGIFDDPINEMRGPGPTVSVVQFNHGNPGIVGGGMLADDFIPLPAHFAKHYLLPDAPRFGSGLKERVRHDYLRSFKLMGPVQDIPNPESRVTLDPDVVDQVGMPVARLSGTTHPETVRTSQFMAARAEDWMRAAGAREIWRAPVGLGLSAGQHQAGTCRMSDDLRFGVVDARGRVFGHENLLVCDASVHVTNGGFNPFLTAMATAVRSARLFDA